MFTFTMFFSGGMIPSYMLIRNLGMLNTPWALLIPGSIGVYNMIIARTFIQNSIPGEMLDAAKIDGCSDIGYYLKIVLPLSQAIIAVLVLFYGVGHWNAYFNAMIYLNNKSLYPLTIYLREILMSTQIDPSTVSDPEMQMRLAEAAAVIKYSLIVVTLVPVIAIYPFVQKYFIKGVMIGSVKG
jgi:ABC-type glycerol-3-phosphate transport system permease component